MARLCETSGSRALRRIPRTSNPDAGTSRARVRRTIAPGQAPAAEVIARADKDPRIVEGPAPHAHAGTTGFLEHSLRRLGRGHVAVADDRDVLHRGDHRAYAGQVHSASETLLARAPLDK